MDELYVTRCEVKNKTNKQTKTNKNKQNTHVPAGLLTQFEAIAHFGSRMQFPLAVPTADSRTIVPETRYKNCGRKPALAEEQKAAVIAFVKKWRNKRFCTCRYIVQELGLKAKPRTVARVLNDNGFYWRAVPKIHGLSKENLVEREKFVAKYGDRSAAWWEQNMNLVLDGVTLTMPPNVMSKREKHAVQRIQPMWMRSGERMDNDFHTYNRYGIQLGKKVPLWGGFTGGGKFTLRLWTPAQKMTKEAWAKLVPSFKRAVDNADAEGYERNTKCAKVWQDNERFLLQPEVYKKSGLMLERFPPNSGDLNPIETVWVALRKELAVREQEDLANGVSLTVSQFKNRCAQILRSFSVPKEGCEFNYLQKLVRGMAERLARCRKNKFGRCGK